MVAMGRATAATTRGMSETREFCRMSPTAPRRSGFFLPGPGRSRTVPDAVLDGSGMFSAVVPVVPDVLRSCQKQLHKGGGPESAAAQLDRAHVQDHRDRPCFWLHPRSGVQDRV